MQPASKSEAAHVNYGNSIVGCCWNRLDEPDFVSAILFRDLVITKNFSRRVFLSFWNFILSMDGLNWKLDENLSFDFC